MARRLFGFVLLISVGAIGYLILNAPEKIKIPFFLVTPRLSDNAEAVRTKILVYQKPARVEVINYIKNPTHNFQKVVEDVKKLKVPLNEKSDFYIKILFFVDETDKTAPLMAQFLFLEIKNNNLIKEDTLKLE